jgi:hypothetical protein
MTLPATPFVCENIDWRAMSRAVDLGWSNMEILAAALGKVIPAEVETGMLEELAQVEPITWSTEGLDDGCLFCGADAKCVWEPEYERYAVHRPTCLWVRVRLLLGHDLGIHRVDGQPVVSDKE